MNNPERVQALEALLSRIKKNAAEPRLARAVPDDSRSHAASAAPAAARSAAREGAAPVRFDPRAEPVSEPAFNAVPDPLAATAQAPAAPAPAKPAPAKPAPAKPAPAKPAPRGGVRRPVDRGQLVRRISLTDELVLEVSEPASDETETLLEAIRMLVAKQRR